MGFINQSRPQFLINPLLAILSSHIIAENFNLVQLFFSSTSFIFLHIFVCSVNNTYDVVSDTVSTIMSRQNPLVTGELTLRDAQIINVVTPCLALITSLVAGPLWSVFILVGIWLVMLYDLQPFRLKDRPLGVLFPPLAMSLPFLFGYMNSTSGFFFPPSVLLVFIFFYLNALTLLRHIPDVEQDIRMGVQNFTASFGVEASRYLEFCAGISMSIIFVTSLFLGLWSIIGLPFVLVATFLKLNILTKPLTILRDPRTWKRFAPLMLVNNVAITLSLAGNVVLLP